MAPLILSWDEAEGIWWWSVGETLKFMTMASYSAALNLPQKVDVRTNGVTQAKHTAWNQVHSRSSINIAIIIISTTSTFYFFL